MNREAYNVSGKDKCRILKRIRAEIAAQNDIDLVIEECPYKGECRGTCPRCEAEVRYLEAELEKRRDEEKEVRLDGLFGDLPDPAPLGKESPEGDEDERWAVLPEGDFNVEDDLFLSGPEGREPRLPHLPLMGDLPAPWESEDIERPIVDLPGKLTVVSPDDEEEVVGNVTAEFNDEDDLF